MQRAKSGALSQRRESSQAIAREAAAHKAVVQCASASTWGDRWYWLPHAQRRCPDVICLGTWQQRGGQASLADLGPWGSLRDALDSRRGGGSEGGGGSDPPL